MSSTFPARRLTHYTIFQTLKSQVMLKTCVLNVRITWFIGSRSLCFCRPSKLNNDQCLMNAWNILECVMYFGISFVNNFWIYAWNIKSFLGWVRKSKILRYAKFERNRMQIEGFTAGQSPHIEESCTIMNLVTAKKIKNIKQFCWVAWLVTSSR